ncbi:hypothetical protein [Sphingomonas faeni]|uniref:hypothetical protein n=1 Tax=Sphingomonas faeni TaxID=185950 RepID=UPI0020C756AE|nr:hypothetical protein [Sphingomonas faeni]MCP8893008.1 hypothetical protein [Sphingomonas faeni]
MIRKFLATVKAEASFLVLLAVAAVGCWLYAQYRTVSADRDDLRHRAELICAGSGVGFAAIGNTARGILCAQTVAGLVKFKSDSDQLAAATLAQAMADHDARQNDDTRAARAAAEAASSAAQRMEMADAQAERTNLVDSDWFRAVNGVAGLRPAR